MYIKHLYTHQCNLWNVRVNCLLSEGDSLTYHLGQKFSTQDQDNDASSSSCAVTYKGGWWHNACHHSNLNGLYRNGSYSSSHSDGVTWIHWKGHYYSLRFSEMKMRPFNVWSERQPFFSDITNYILWTEENVSLFIFHIPPSNINQFSQFLLFISLSIFITTFSASREYPVPNWQPYFTSSVLLKKLFAIFVVCCSHKMFLWLYEF